MAELTVLESKLGEVTGLAMAAQGATEKISKLVEEGRPGAAEGARPDEPGGGGDGGRHRGGGEYEGKKTAFSRRREVKQEATEMMRTYLGDDADALDGFEFLTMAEAGEVGHWSIVDVLAHRARDARASTLAAWAKPIQERHFEQAKEGSLKLAQAEDPNATE
jgi:hypothetical protein